MSSDGGEFRGTERFVIRQRLGAGGFGVVYRAQDREHGTDVALKWLKNVDPGTLYRFKSEFRSLTGVTHPNLVALRELVSEGVHWFFTMELVDGVGFLDHVWGEPAVASLADEETSPSPGVLGATRAGLPSAPRVDEPRLRSALGGLAQGVHALHEAGYLHRDLKPSNVLVDRGGRVVVLDFGLVAELAGTRAGESTDTIVGTVAYMAPEQGLRQGVSEASDWYAVGALLYECLTGRVPFVGSAVQVLMDKGQFEPAPPSSLAPGVPEDLDRLCSDLLRRQPGDRPTGRQVLDRLGASPVRPATPLFSRAVAASPAPSAPRPPQPSHASPGGGGAVQVAAPSSPESPLGFVGRAQQLAALEAGLEAVRAGKSVALFVKGRSGMGKTALVRHFLEQALRDPDHFVLQGRCYQREFVPYKTLDSLVDALARRLRRMPPREVEVLLPRDVQALAQVFPVLQQVDLVANAPQRVPQAPDPQELRRRAFSALRELLGRIGERFRLVLFIDDLQWGDPDGFALLAELFRPPDPPALLLLASYRAEDEAACLVLRAMIASHAEALPAVELREVTVDALTHAEARQLARVRLGSGAAGGAVEAIAQEAGGSPFFLDVLAGAAVELQGPRPSLEQVLRAWVEQLPEPQRRLLEVVAAAGKPVPRAVAFEAARLDQDPLAVLSALESTRFVRALQGRVLDTVELFHDRLREPALDHLKAPDLARLHLRLARALEAAGQRDDETLARHYADGGERALAARHATAAAERSAAALAFEHAAFLFQWALELMEPTDARRRALEVQLGDVLALAGRGAEAAKAYFRALEGVAGAPLADAVALDVRRRAAEQLLRSGHTDEGLEALRAVLAAVDLKLARSPQTARASLLWRRARVWARGLGFRERSAEQVSPRVLTRIDVCWSAAQGLGMVDVIRGAAFQAKHLLLALDAGEPNRVARALAVEAAFAAVGGTASEPKVNAILARAEELAVRLDNPNALGLVRFGEAMRELLCGRWKTAHEAAEQAMQVFRDRGQGVSFERVNAQLVSLWSLFYLGELRALTEQVVALRQEALERGDQYAVTASGLANLAALVEDEPEVARKNFEAMLQGWSNQGFHLPHFWGLLAQGLVDFYSGENRAPWERLHHLWPALQGSLLLNIQHVRIASLLLRACSALQAAVAGVDPVRLVDLAERDALRIEKEGTAWGAPLVEVLRGGAATLRGDLGPAVAHLELAEKGFRAQDMASFAAAARRRRGELLGGEEGGALVASADAWMRSQQVKNPARFAAMLAPGR